jgi:uncharacterized RDD family membrane protein YckC
MTQQGDMTGQEAGTQQPGQAPVPADQAAAPWWPSPYLVDGQTPQAYPAPARPGQPRYAAPAGAPGATRAAFGQAGYGQPAAPPSGQPGVQPGWGGQPSYGQQRQGLLTRPVPAGRAVRQRDQTLAGFWERLLAATIDWILILTVAFAILHTEVLRFWHQIQVLLNDAQTLSQAATQSAYTNFFQSPATNRTIVTYYAVAFGIAVIYFWALQAAGGATLGKRLLGIQVVSAADRGPISVRTAGIRTAALLLGPAMFSIASKVAVLGGAASTLGGILWVADGFVLVTSAQRQSLHDRAAGTLVIRKAANGPVS